MNTIRKRDHYYLLEKIYTELAILILPGVSRTPITPNHITLANYVNGILAMILIASHHYYLAALLVQLYLFLDILDGNLARYKQQFSKLGAKLDNFGDRFFYNAVMIVIGWVTQIHWGWILAFLISHNLHALLATVYIVPCIRATTSFKRFALKQWLMDKGYILGMDLSLQAAIISALLLASAGYWIIPVATMLYTADLLLRLAEVWRRS